MMKTRNEVRLSSIALAALAIGCAILMLRPATSEEPITVFHVIAEGWELLIAFWLLGSGAMQAVGALYPKRCLRQLGLVLSSIGWLALFGVLLQAWLLYYAIIVLLVGVASFCSYWRDVLGKPRGNNPFPL